MSGRKGNDVFSKESPQGSMAEGWKGETTNVLADDFGLTIPTEIIPLPSQGVIYEEGTNLNMRERVEIRAMTAREEDILTNRAFIKSKSVISQLIKSCLIDKSVDPDNLIAGDRNALMVALRITGYGHEYDVEAECPACGERSKQTFDLSKLPIKNFSKQPVALGSNVFEFELPLTKKKVRFKYLNGHEEKEIAVIEERMKKRGYQRSNAVTTRFQHQVISIDNISDKPKVQKFCQNMPARDSLALRKFMDRNEPGIEMKQHMSCPHCFEETEVRLPMGASFFWPDSE